MILEIEIPKEIKFFSTFSLVKGKRKDFLGMSRAPNWQLLGCRAHRVTA